MKHALNLLFFLSLASSICFAEVTQPNEREKIIAAYFHGWNIRSLDEILGTMNDDIVYQDPSERIVGKERLRQYFAELLQRFPALSLHVDEIDPSGSKCPADVDSIAVRYTSEITDSNGNFSRNVGIDCFSFSNGKIQSFVALAI